MGDCRVGARTAAQPSPRSGTHQLPSTGRPPCRRFQAPDAGVDLLLTSERQSDRCATPARFTESVMLVALPRASSCSQPKPVVANGSQIRDDEIPADVVLAFASSSRGTLRSAAGHGLRRDSTSGEVAGVEVGGEFAVPTHLRFERLPGFTSRSAPQDSARISPGSRASR